MLALAAVARRAKEATTPNILDMSGYKREWNSEGYIGKVNRERGGRGSGRGRGEEVRWLVGNTAEGIQPFIIFVTKRANVGALPQSATVSKKRSPFQEKLGSRFICPDFSQDPLNTSRCWPFLYPCH